MISLFLLFFSNEMLRMCLTFVSFQVVVALLMPVKLSCSRFTTKMDIILSN